MRGRRTGLAIWIAVVACGWAAAPAASAADTYSCAFTGLRGVATGMDAGAGSGPFEILGYGPSYELRCLHHDGDAAGDGNGDQTGLHYGTMWLRGTWTGSCYAYSARGRLQIDPAGSGTLLQALAPLPEDPEFAGILDVEITLVDGAGIIAIRDGHDADSQSGAMGAGVMSWRDRYPVLDNACLVGSWDEFETEGTLEFQTG